LKGSEGTRDKGSGLTGSWSTRYLPVYHPSPTHRTGKGGNLEKEAKLKYLGREGLSQTSAKTSGDYREKEEEKNQRGGGDWAKTQIFTMEAFRGKNGTRVK